MIPTNDLKQFARYKTIYTVRQSDGAKLVANRVVTHEKLPVRWDAEVIYPQPTFSNPPLVQLIEPPSTSKLIKRAAEEGFGDWFPESEGTEELFPFDALGDKSKAQRIPKYPAQDTTDYLVD